MENNKKTLINTKIQEEDIEKYSKIIVKKALSVIACKGSIYAIKLLENKDMDTLEDLRQEVAIQIMLDNYVITRNSYKTVRKFLYDNYEKTEIEIFTTEEKQEEKEEQASFISYINNNNEEMKKPKRIDFEKLQQKLSKTEKKIFQYYFINNMQQVNIAKMTDTTKSNINILIKRIKKKAVECLEV